MTASVGTDVSDVPRSVPDTDNPEEIHHFTDLGGFRGIIENRCLWASNVLFLNDSREIDHGLEATEALIQAFLDLGNNRKWEEPLLHAVEALKARDIPNTYVTCFCAEPDLLSLWRGYGGTRQGISISFGRKEIEYQFKSQEAQLERVLYGDQTKKEIFETILNKLEGINKLDRFLGPRGVGITPYSLQVDYTHRLVSRILPKIKHSGFEDEREWRIIIQDPYNNLENVKFRSGLNTLIPYIELSEPNGEKLPITAVWVGPGSTGMPAKESIQQFLKKHGYGHVPVEISKVPFRI